MNGKDVTTKDVNYLLFKGDNNNKVDIMLFFEGLNEENKIAFQQIGFILLDTA